jgi:hypothetical protein
MAVKAEGKKQRAIMNYSRWSAYVPHGGRLSGVEVLNRGQRNETKLTGTVGQAVRLAGGRSLSVCSQVTGAGLRTVSKAKHLLMRLRIRGVSILRPIYTVINPMLRYSLPLVALGGLVVVVLAIGSKVCGFKAGRGR